MKNDPSFIIYSAQNINGNFSPYIHQQLLLWKLQFPDPVNVLIGDEIGLGKTIEAILLIHHLLKKRGARRILLLLPKVLKNQWIGELKKFFPEIDLHLLRRENLSYYCRSNAPDGIYIISIDTAKKDRNSLLLRRVEWDAVVVDEAHNLGSDSLRDTFVGKLKTKHKIFLSATPHRGDSRRYLRLLRHLDESIDESKDNPSFYIKTHNSLLHRRTKKLVNQIEKSRVFTDCTVYAVVTEASDTEKEFGNNITDFLTSILKNRGDDTPIGLLVALLRKRVSSSPRSAIKTLERIIQPSEDGTGVKETVLEKLLGESFEDVGEAIEEANVEEVDEIYNKVVEKYRELLTPSEISRLAEFIDMARKIEEERDSKLEALKDILDKHLERGEKVIVFTEYRDTLEYLYEKLKDYNPVAVYGGMSESESEARINEFLTSGNVLIATDVASEGLNLQEANVVVNYEPPWTPIKLEQRMGRVWRMRQKRDVFIYNLFLGIRADIELARILYEKMMLIRDALSDVKNIIGEDIQFATSRKIESVEDMLDSSTLPTSVKYRNKVRRFSEHQLIRAQLEGELDEFVEAILDHIRRLKHELSVKRVYPVENAVVIKDVSERLGLVSREDCESLIKDVVSYALPDKPITSDFKPQVYLRELEKLGEDLPEYLVVTDERDGIDYVAIAEVDLGTHRLRIPLIYSDGSVSGGSRDVKLGAKALEYLLTVARRSAVPDEVYTRETLEPSRYAIKNRLEDRLNVLIQPFRGYGWDTAIRGIEIKILCKVLRLSIETLSGSKEYSRNVGFQAEKFAAEYERSRGFEVDSRQTLMKYDLYSFDPSEADKPEGHRNSERYIEVKGHGKGGVLGELPMDEFKLGKEMGDKYWLYLVWYVLEGSPVLVAFRDPLNRDDLLEYSVSEQEVTVKKQVVKLRFKF